ncbi:hypothetical protein [Kaarinaea lacus]
MRILPRVLQLVIVLTLLLFLASCASTQLTAVWSDESFSGGPLKKLLVVSILDNPRNRGLVEAALVSELKKNGVEALSSAKVMGDKELNKDNVIAVAGDHQVDSVMAVRLLGVDEEQAYYPSAGYNIPDPYYYRWNTYYPHMYDYADPGYMVTYKYVNLETNIYAAETKTLVWSAASETFDPQNINEEAQQFAQKIVKGVRKSGLIK